MNEKRLQSILDALQTSGLWFGGPSPAGSLRGVGAEQAARKPDGASHCIWELALHIAYWEYAVRRILEDGPKGEFPRKPANWPRLPDDATESAWKKDRALVRAERERLISAAGAFDPARLDDRAGSSKHTYVDLLYGAVQHSTYHTGQIALLKRLDH